MILIVSPAFVKENTVLNYNVDDGYLKPLIDSIQNTFVRPILVVLYLMRYKLKSKLTRYLTLTRY
jgi:hypothetical protein